MSTTKVAVVTGGNKGIGFAIVEGLCKSLKGYDVLLTARDVTRGEEAVAKLKDLGVNPKFFKLDITNKETIEGLRAHLADTYGGLDVLVNNAGIAFKNSSTASFSEQAEVSMATNFTGTLDVCEALFPLLRPGARVVHLSTRVSQMALAKCSNDMLKKLTALNTINEVKKEMASFVEATKEGNHTEKGYPNTGYGMSKVGVTAMTPIQQAAIDANADILINSCCPGYVDTDMTSHTGTKTIEQGADTPIYLATLPAGTTSPKGDFVAEKKIIKWKETKEGESIKFS